MRKKLFGILSFLMLQVTCFSQSFEFYEPLSAFQADRGALERKYTLKETREYYDRISSHHQYWLDYIAGIDYQGLSFDGKIDYLMFRNYLQKAVFFNKIEERTFNEVAFVNSF